jgi:hypothetical protein
MQIHSSKMKVDTGFILLIAYILRGANVCHGSAVTTVLQYTGSVQQYFVPSNVFSLLVTVAGASGGDASQYSGGLAGIVNATIAVTPRTTVYIFVGGHGSKGEVVGGFNGGGASTYTSSGSGGGATDIRYPTSTLADRVVVAGGGGGGDGYCSARGGAGGFPAGIAGEAGNCIGNTGGGG